MKQGNSLFPAVSSSYSLLCSGNNLLIYLQATKTNKSITNLGKYPNNPYIYGKVLSLMKVPVSHVLHNNIHFYWTFTCWYSNDPAQGADPLLQITLRVSHERIGTSLSVSWCTWEIMVVFRKWRLSTARKWAHTRLSVIYIKISREDLDCYQFVVVSDFPLRR